MEEEFKVTVRREKREFEKCRKEASVLLYPQTDPSADWFCKASDPTRLGSVLTEPQTSPRIHLGWIGSELVSYGSEVVSVWAFRA